jgi:hypothetical protein
MEWWTVGRSMPPALFEGGWTVDSSAEPHPCHHYLTEQQSACLIAQTLTRDQYAPCWPSAFFEHPSVVAAQPDRRPLTAAAKPPCHNG